MVTGEHILVLISQDEFGEWDYDVEHPLGCPYERAEIGDWLSIDQHVCGVGLHLNTVSLPDLFEEPLPEMPGRYVIRDYHRECFSPGTGYETEAGLEIVCREETA